MMGILSACSSIMWHILQCLSRCAWTQIVHFLTLCTRDITAANENVTRSYKITELVIKLHSNRFFPLFLAENVNN